MSRAKAERQVSQGLGQSTQAGEQSRTGGKGLAGRLDGSWGPWGVKVVLCVSKGWKSLGSKVWVKMKSEPKRSVGMAGGERRGGKSVDWASVMRDGSPG